MEQAYINDINLKSSFFARLTEERHTVNGLTDGVVYVVSEENEEAEAAIRKVKEALSSSMFRKTWVTDYGCDFMPKDIAISSDTQMGKLIAEGHNLVMPLIAPDSNAHIYLVGKIDNLMFLDSAVSFLTVDADLIISSVISHALSNVSPETIEAVLTGLSEQEVERLFVHPSDSTFRPKTDDIHFRGNHAANPISVIGDTAVETERRFRSGELTYQERTKMLSKLPNIIKRRKSDDPQVRAKADEEYQELMGVLSKHEIYKMLDSLLLSTKPSVTKNITSEVTDREAMGRKTAYHIVLSKREKNRKPYNFHDDYAYWLFIKEKDGTLHPVKMQKASMTIYVLSLIEKVTKDRNNYIVDVKKNHKAYIEANRRLFDNKEEEAEKSYNGLKINRENRQGKLGECYSDIEFALQTTFKNLKEDYSPFLANRQFPLTITKEKIELPENFLSLKIH